MRESYEVDQPLQCQRVHFEGITLAVEPPVYSPREDSFLLANAVKRFARGNVLDMGTGSGIQAIIAAKKLEVESVTAVDLSKAALVVAQKNTLANQVSAKVSFVKSNLFEKVTGKFDIIIYNPPYLPVEKNEVRDEQSMAWHGGKDGRDFLDPFLVEFPSHLNENAMLLLLQSSLNGQVKTKRILERMGFEIEVVASQAFFFEKIYVFKAVKA